MHHISRFLQFITHQQLFFFFLFLFSMRKIDDVQIDFSLWIYYYFIKMSKKTLQPKARSQELLKEFISSGVSNSDYLGATVGIVFT